MARKRKTRTHLKDSNAKADTTSTGTPKSFIIKHGQVGSSLTQLVRDIRKVMEPNTASRLKVRGSSYIVYSMFLFYIRKEIEIN
jgi:ribosome biogenesis protein SSF1/2